MEAERVITVQSLCEIKDLIDEPGTIITIIQKGESDGKTISSEAGCGPAGSGTAAVIRNTH